MLGVWNTNQKCLASGGNQLQLRMESRTHGIPNLGTLDDCVHRLHDKLSTNVDPMQRKVNVPQCSFSGPMSQNGHSSLIDRLVLGHLEEMKSFGQV